MLVCYSINMGLNVVVNFVLPALVNECENFYLEMTCSFAYFTNFLNIHVQFSARCLIDEF